MAGKCRSGVVWCLGAIFLIVFFLGEVTPVEAGLTLGKKYDQSNYQEIQDLLFPALLNWTKSGQLELQTGKLEFTWRKSDAFWAASAKNEGKYDLDATGLLIETGSGKPPAFVYGFPFPTIDPRDPQAAAKIMENHAAQLYSIGSHHISSNSRWLGKKGDVQLEAKSNTSFLFYQQRREGPIPNRESLLYQQLDNVLAPFQLRGMNQMLWSYNDLRDNTAFVYVPSLRRVRKISTSDSSNPRLGSDVASDDQYGWSGKNTTMNWKLLGEKTLLRPFSSSKKYVVEEFPDGAIDRVFISLKLGHELSSWKGAPWYPLNLVWSPVDYWIIEAKPKDPKYFYGKQIIYVDKGAYTSFIKEIFDEKENYWKTMINIGSYQVTPTGRDLLGILDFCVMVDDKKDHSTYLKILKLPGTDHRLNLPLAILGPKNFTTDAFVQTTK
jgi:hypothetical protein